MSSALGSHYSFDDSTFYKVAMKTPLLLCLFFLFSVNSFASKLDFLEAVKEGKTNIVEYILTDAAHKKDIRKVDEDDRTALHIAAESGNLEIVKLLVESDPEILERKDESNRTALHYAAYEGHLSVVEYLIQKAPQLVNKANKNVERKPFIQKEENFTPLHYAAQEGRLEVVRFLVDHGANLIASAGYFDSYKTPIAKAAKNGHFAVVKHLLAQIIALTPQLDSSHIRDVFRAAVMAKSLEIIEYLFIETKEQDRKPFYKDINDALAAAITNKEFEIAKIILHYEPNIAAYTENPYGSATEITHTNLHRAIEKGQLEIVKLLVENGASLEILSSDKKTPMQLAIFKNFPKIEIYLLEKGASVENTHIALARTLVETGEVELYDSLLKDYPGTFKDDKDGFLNLAARKGQLKIVQYLLENYPNLLKEEQTILHSAARYGKLDIVKYLVKKAEEIEKNEPGSFKEGFIHRQCNYGNTALHVAVQGFEKVDKVTKRTAKIASIEVVKYLLSKGAKIEARNSIGDTILHRSLVGEQYEIAKYLIEKGARINAENKYGDTALSSAVHKKNFNFVQYLVQKGAKWDEKAFLNAAIFGQVDIIKFFLEKNKFLKLALGRDGKNALILAAECGHLEAVKYLLSVGFDINSQDNYGYTALHKAVWFYEPDIIQTLLEHDALVNIADKEGKTALYFATYSRRFNTMQKLIEKGANINARLNTGETILHRAILNTNFDMVKYLMEHGAMYDVLDSEVNSALHYVAQRGNLNMAKYFLEKGLSYSQENSKGQTPVSIAGSEDYMESKKKLLQLFQGEPL